MNIVHYMAGFRVESGGVMRAVLDMCQALAARGETVTLFETAVGSGKYATTA